MIKMMDQIVKHIPCYCAHATNVRFCCVKDQGQQVGEGENPKEENSEDNLSTVTTSTLWEET
ncbi:unnamed protein product [Prunus armeniaca]